MNGPSRSPSCCAEDRPAASNLAIGGAVEGASIFASQWAGQAIAQDGQRKKSLALTT